MHYDGHAGRTQLPHSARSAEPIEPSRGRLMRTTRYESEAAGGVKEGAGEPAQLQAGQFGRREPGELAELAITGCRGTVDDPGFIDSGDVGGVVAVGVADLVIGPAGRVRQAHQHDVGADLFAGFPDRRRGRRFAPLSTAPPRTPHPSSWPAWRTSSTRPASSTGRTDTDGTSSSSWPMTARSLAICAAIPTWVTLRSGRQTQTRARGPHHSPS
jgi:hypothetical protein